MGRHTQLQLKAADLPKLVNPQLQEPAPAPPPRANSNRSGLANAVAIATTLLFVS
jgi:hypothetical protein